MKYRSWLLAASLVAASASANEPPGLPGPHPPRSDGSGHARPTRPPAPLASGPHLQRRGPVDLRDAGVPPGMRPGLAGARFLRMRRELHDTLRDKSATSEELQQKIAAWRAARAERRRERRREIFMRWGHAARSVDAEGELKLHARRIARLERIEQIMATERSGPERDKALARIDQIRDRENQRHDRAMARITGETANASASASASAAPSASGAAP